MNRARYIQCEDDESGVFGTWCMWQMINNTHAHDPDTVERSRILYTDSGLYFYFLFLHLNVCVFSFLQQNAQRI